MTETSYTELNTLEEIKNSKGKIIAVDFGDVRTGLAVSDVSRLLASGIGNISVGGIEKTAEAIAESAKENGAYKGSVETAVRAAMGGNTQSGPMEMIIGKYNLDPLYYTELTEEAFSLDVHEIGDLIYTASAYEYGYNIIFCAEKSDEHFSESYDYIKGIFIDNEIGRHIDEMKRELSGSIEETDFMKSLNPASVSMG